MLGEVRRKFLILLSVAATFAAGVTRGQGLVPPEEVASSNVRMNGHSRRNTLKFYNVSLSKQSSLNFNFRYQTGFAFAFPLGEMPEGGKIHALIRATPKEGAPVMLSEQFDIPPVKDAVNQMLLNFGGEMMANFGGSFTIGPGVYQIELLLYSEDGRAFFKKWTVKTEKTNDPASLTKANVVDTLMPSQWAGKLDPSGIRLTLLLNATATEIWKTKLRDYAYLMQMASSVLEMVPCRSVRFVAFNLDNQNELFRRENFDSTGWQDLAKALKDPQFATIDYHALKKGAEPKFLTRLVQEESSSSSDVVILLGRSSHFQNKTPKDLKGSLQASTARIFYLQHDGFLPSDGLEALTGSDSPIDYHLLLNRNEGWPDSLAYLVRDVHGTVLHFATPHQFAKSLEQLRARLATPTTLVANERKD